MFLGYNPYTKPYSNQYFKLHVDHATEIVGQMPNSDFDVYFTGISDEEPGTRSCPMIRDVHIIECCTGGRGTITINGTTFSITEGCCYVFFPNDVIIQSADDDSHLMSAWFGFKGLKTDLYLQLLGVSSQQPFLNSNAYEHILKCVYEIHEAAQTKSIGNDLQQIACVNLIFSKLFQLSKEVDSAAMQSAYIRDAISYIETHYSEAIKISDIAKMLGLNRSYFFTLFKQATGFSPQDFIIHFRIKKSCEFLSNFYSPIADVAAAVGYNPVNYSRMFKTIIGISPTAFRANLRNQKT